MTDFKHEILWGTRDRAIEELHSSFRRERDLLYETFIVMDECIHGLSLPTSLDIELSFPLSLVVSKGRNLSLGWYSMILDGVEQEAGALERPLLEALELLMYLTEDPKRVSEVYSDSLPRAGEIAKRIGGKLKHVRDKLNREAAHFSFSANSIVHLIDVPTFDVKSQQLFSPARFKEALRHLFSFNVGFALAAVIAVELVSRGHGQELAARLMGAWKDGVEVFELEAKEMVDGMD